ERTTRCRPGDEIACLPRPVVAQLDPQLRAVCASQFPRAPGGAHRQTTRGRTSPLRRRTKDLASPGGLEGREGQEGQAEQRVFGSLLGRAFPSCGHLLVTRNRFHAALISSIESTPATALPRHSDRVQTA